MDIQQLLHAMYVSGPKGYDNPSKTYISSHDKSSVLVIGGSWRTSNNIWEIKCLGFNCTFSERNEVAKYSHSDTVAMWVSEELVNCE